MYRNLHARFRPHHGGLPRTGPRPAARLDTVHAPGLGGLHQQRGKQIALPITFAHVTESNQAGMAAGTFAAVSSGLYEASRFSIGGRMQRSPHRLLLLAVVVTAPLTGALSIHTSLASWIWTLAVTAVLVALSVSYLRDPMGERPTDEANEWYVRH